MASEMMDGFIAGKMDSGGGNGCCMPMMPMMPYGFGMPWGMGMGMGMMGGYGMGGMWEWIPILLIFALLGNNGGFGFGGGNAATQADLAAGFANSNVLAGLNDIKLGQANATNYTNQGFAGLNTALMSGFHGMENAICNLGYQTQSGFNAISREIGDCCCKTQNAIQGVNFNLAKGLCDLGNVINMQTRDIVDNQNANYRGLMDFLVQEKLASKDAKIADLQLQASQANQNNVIGARLDAAVAEILRRSGHDCPSAAYIVQPPTPVNFPTNCCGTVQFGNYNGGYGCGCGCAA